MLPIVIAILAAPFIGTAFAKPEQIRAVQDPIFHYYLQSYPQNSTSDDCHSGGSAREKDGF